MPDTTGARTRNLGGLAAALTSRFRSSAVVRDARQSISGVDSSNFPSALQPVAPVGRQGMMPMALPIQPGQNLIFTPRADAEYSAKQLKFFATYPLARLCIDQVKDLIADLPWQITAKQLPGESKKKRQNREREDPIIQQLTALFEYPNPDQSWKQFIRRLLEDLLVLDAPCVQMRRFMDKKGTIGELRVIPGETIVRYIDDNGHTPQAPDIAYAQNWEGLPMVALTTDDIVYMPRNIVPRNTNESHLYGMSHTEKLAPVIQVGQARLAFVHAYYKDGSVPGAMQIVPSDVDMDKVQASQEWLNSKLAGNLTARQQWQLVPGFQKDGKAEQVIFPKEPLLTDAFDDLHIRQICYGYGVSAQRLLKMLNRATAGENQEAAEDEGIAPVIGFVKEMVDYIIQRKMMLAGYEWTPKPAEVLDEKTQAEIDAIDLRSGVRTENECREDRGLDPYDIPEANMPGLVTANGWLAISLEARAAAAAVLNPAQPDDDGSASSDDDTAPNDDDGSSKKPSPKGPGSKKKVAKRSTTKLKIQPERSNHTLAALETKAVTALAGFFATATEEAAAAAVNRVRKADAGDDAPLSEKEVDRIVDAMMDAISWPALHAAMLPVIEGAAREGAEYGIKGLQDAGALPTVAPAIAQITTHPIAALEHPTSEHSFPAPTKPPTALVQALISKVNDEAKAEAEQRAAELVGMRLKEDGTLVANPNAKWAITDVTRTRLRAVIADSFSRSTSKDELVAAIKESAAFNDARAKLIATAEIKFAQAGANYQAWIASGVVEGSYWKTSSLHEQIDECDDNAATGIVKLGASFPSGVKHTPAHPRCTCYVIGVVKV